MLPSLYFWGLIYNTEPTEMSQGSPTIFSGGKTWPLVAGLDGADDLN